jgi:fatty acid desaturase
MVMPWDLIFGGVTGLIGTIWSSYNKRKERELELKDRDNQRAHERDMVEVQTRAMQAEAEANIRVTEAQVAGAVELENARAFQTSQLEGNKDMFRESFMERLFAVEGWVRFIAVPFGVLVCVLFGLADFVKSIARPSITMYLLGVSTWITTQAWDILEAKDMVLTSLQATTILSNVIGTVLYLTVTAVTWWFGDRMAAKGMEQLLPGKGRKR